MGVSDPEVAVSPWGDRGKMWAVDGTEVHELGVGECGNAVGRSHATGIEVTWRSAELACLIDTHRGSKAKLGTPLLEQGETGDCCEGHEEVSKDESVLLRTNLPRSTLNR